MCKSVSVNKGMGINNSKVISGILGYRNEAWANFTPPSLYS